MAERDLRVGMKRGIQRQCPNCGEARLFRGYVKVAPRCVVCAHPNGQYRVDDAAPYFTVLIVGHLVLAPMLTLGIIGTWPLAPLMTLMLTLVLGATLALLPFVKGAVIGAMWSLGADAELAPVRPDDPMRDEGDGR